MSSKTPGASVERLAAPLILAATAALGCWLAAPAAAQEPAVEEPFVERVDVTIVNVDVWVTDKQGAPVTGLGADSFRVLHNGQPVPLSHFTEVRDGYVASAAAAGQGAATSAAAEPVAAEPSHLVVYFDQSRLHPSNVGSLIRGVEELLDSGAAEPERILILRQENSLSVEAPFGSSRGDLQAALGRLRKTGAGGLDVEAEMGMALQAINSAWEQASDAAGSGEAGIALIPSVANPANEPGVGGGSPSTVVGGVGSGSGGPDACGSFVNQVQPTLESWVRSRAQRVAISLANLSDMASFLAGLPGVKTVLYLSDGLDTQPGAALATYASDLCPEAGAELLSGSLGEAMNDRFVELTRHANANRVTIHALQATGLRSPGAGSAASDGGVRGGRSQRSSGSFEARRRAGDRAGLGLIAGETGGRSVFNRNEFGAEMVDIGRESRNYYSLAYELPPDNGRQSHRIEVKLGDGSLTPRYRRGYLEKSDEEWLTERIEGALNLGITKNALAVRLGAGAIRLAEDGNSILPLHVMIPVGRLAFLPHEGGTAAEVMVKVLARGVGSQALAVREQTFRLRGAPGATGFATLPIELTLPAGTYLTAIGVQDRGTGEASFISTTLSAGSEG